MSSSTVLIRDAIEADLPALGGLLAEIADLHVAARPDVFAPVPSAGLDLTFLQRYFTAPDARIFVAVDMDSSAGVGVGAVIGLVQCAVRQAPDVETVVPRAHVHVEDLVVAASARRRGVGRALMARAEAWARELGILTLELTVFSFNTAAQHLYEELGYFTSYSLLTKHLDAPR